MNYQHTIVIDFSLPASSEQVFDFVILPENMPLFRGFLLIPGIKKVHSSHSSRSVGCVDSIINTDGSSHSSVTLVLEKNRNYELKIGKIMPVGWKKSLANPLEGFTESWVFEERNQQAYIRRRLSVIYHGGVFNALLVRTFIIPQLYFSLLIHHRELRRHFLAVSLKNQVSKL